MVRVLQGNMHRSGLAHDLFTQIKLENTADVIIISEQYRNKDTPTRFSDKLSTAAIWAPGVVINRHGSGNGYLWIKSNGITYVSFYLTPNEPMDAFRSNTDALVDELRDMDCDLIVAGDFNAKAIECSEGKQIPKEGE